MDDLERTIEAFVSSQRAWNAFLRRYYPKPGTSELSRLCSSLKVSADLAYDNGDYMKAAKCFGCLLKLKWAALPSELENATTLFTECWLEASSSPTGPRLEIAIWLVEGFQSGTNRNKFYESLWSFLVSAQEIEKQLLIATMKRLSVDTAPLFR